MHEGVYNFSDQLLPQLLMEQFDTCRHTLNICMKEFIIFVVCTDSTEIFSKLSLVRSAGLNYNLPSFFTDTYCAGGI